MRRIILGLFLLGVVTAAVGRLEPYYIAWPQVRSLDEAKAAIDRPEQRIVTVLAAPETGSPWYGAKHLGPFGDAHFDASKKEIPLSKYSPTAGIPLIGPRAPPAGEWPKLVGHDVVVEAPLGGRRLMFSERRDVTVGDSTIRDVNSRRILSSLDTTANIWVLSKSHAALGGLEGRRADYTAAEREWADSKSHTGVLKRLRDHDLGADFESVKVNYRELYGDPAHLDEAWLVEIGELNGGGNLDGWYFYVPVAGSEGKIWAQVPADAASEKAWRENPPSEVTGVWVAAGSHRFDPTNAGFPAGRVALVQTAGYDRDKFVDRRWSEWWGRFTVFLGCAMIAFSGLLFLFYKVAFGPDPSPGPAADGLRP